MKVPKLSAPLLIGGCPRSGTTALVQLFNSNPCVHISSEENLLNVARALTKLLGTRERRAKVYKEKGTRVLSERETLSADNILSSNFCEKAVWPTIYHLYRWHHNRIHQSSPLVLWGDKFPNYFKEIDAVLYIPNVRYLHITRNPFDVVNSMLRRTEMAKQDKDWWKAITDFDEMLNTWSEAYLVAMQIEGRAEVLHIQYENLVFDFAASIVKINDFLGTSLDFNNILVSDRSKHHDRSFLSTEMLERILANSEVNAYLTRYGNLPCLNSALKDINDFRG